MLKWLCAIAFLLAAWHSLAAAFARDDAKVTRHLARAAFNYAVAIQLRMWLDTGSW